MIKDNSTGKDKDFYSTGKRMFDNIEVIHPKRKEPKMTITVLNKRIRDALAAAPDGMTASELSFALNIGASQISRSLALMPDVYIDRWVQTRTKYAGVHCLAFVPDDCPHP